MRRLINGIKLWLLNRLLRDLCLSNHCNECPAYMSLNPTSRPLCAHICVYDQAIEKWGVKK